MRDRTRRLFWLGLCALIVGALAGCDNQAAGERVQQEGAGASAGGGPTGKAPVKEDPAGRAAGGSGMPIPK